MVMTSANLLVAANRPNAALVCGCAAVGSSSWLFGYGYFSQEPDCR